MNSITLYDNQALEWLRRELKLDPHTVRQMLNRLCKRFESDHAVRSDFPEIERLVIHSLTVDSRHDSEQDGATKLLFRTAEGMLIESVLLRIATGRTTLCVSSQVGCAAACEFCATGKMGIAQNLAPEEIVDQVLQAGQLLAQENRRLRNIVFMGMGEPFHNEENLYRALELLTAGQYFHHPPTKILISTVGIPEAMIRCARRFPQVNLALSLHSASQIVREEIVPLAKKYPLEAIRDALDAIERIQHRQVMIEYLMLADVNDSPDDAECLIKWLTGLNVHVNLIPYNPIDGAPRLKGSPQGVREQFAGRLKQAGLPTTIRYSLGADIAAACGQLVRRENRQHAIQLHNPQQA